jgi:NAD+ kinase
MLRLHKAIDFVVCLGGDGVLLHASSLYKRAIPPVISFNLGSLGFLTNHTFDDFRRDLRDVITGCEDLTECSLPGEVMRVRHANPNHNPNLRQLLRSHRTDSSPILAEKLCAPAQNPPTKAHKHPDGRVH